MDLVQPALSLKEKSIILIGFMGVGKTTVGQKLAQRLGRPFIDIDKEIEKEYGMTVTEIFNRFGEKEFRKKEREIISRYCQKKLKVFSLGGGAFLQKEIQDICLKSGIVFYLDISWEAWKKRLKFLIDSRPVLQGKSEEEIKELFYKRQKIYSRHTFKISTDHKKVEEIVEEMVQTLKQAWDSAQ